MSWLLILLVNGAPIVLREFPTEQACVDEMLKRNRPGVECWPKESMDYFRGRK